MKRKPDRKKPSAPRQVREPVQVYLDVRDRGLLTALSKRAALSNAEVLRLGLRRLSSELLTDERPGSSIEALIGALDGATDVPADLAARHDDYLYSRSTARQRRKRR